MVNAPAQHPEKALHSSPAAGLGRSCTRLAISRKYAASSTKNPPNAALRACRSIFPSRLITTSEHTVYSAMDGRIFLHSMLLRRDQAITPDCTAHIAAATLGATVMSKKYWAAAIRITAVPKPVSG